jgi:hypothetical protein
MECCRRQYFHFQHIPQHTLSDSEYPLPSFGFGTLYNGRNRASTSAHLLSIFLLEHANILLPLCRTSNRPCHAVHGPFSHSRTPLEGRTHHAVYVGHRAVVRDTKDLDKLLLLKYGRALTENDGSWYTAQAR